MSNQEELTEEEIEKLDRKYQEYMESEHERYMRGIAESYSQVAKESINQCIEKTNEERYYEIEKAFNYWEYSSNRFEGLFICSYIEFDTLLKINSEINDIIYSSISLALNGHYKSALILIRQWLELHITALYFDKIINSRKEDSLTYKKLIKQKQNWLIGRSNELSFIGRCGIVDQFFDFDLEDKATTISKQLRCKWYNKDKTIKDIIKEIYGKLSTTTHFGIININKKIGEETEILPFNYNEEHFTRWFDFFIQVYEITNILLFVYNPKLLNLDAETWGKCFFHFDKNLIKKYI